MRMESDEFDFLAPAYVRGFLKTYCRFLRIKWEPMLEEFDRRFGAGRFESQQIIALERHGRQHTPKEPRLSRSWTAAAVVATGALLILAVVGLILGPEEEEPDRAPTVAEADDSPSVSPSPSAPVPIESTTTASEDAIAFAEGIELEIVASEADCWVQAVSDGGQPVAQTLQMGDSVTFTADDELFVRLGFPEGVELIVNGTSIGSPEGSDPVNLTFPDDIDLFL